MLDKYHLPKKDAFETNYGFKMEITEVEKCVNLKKELADTMARMNGIKLNNMVTDMQERMGFISRK